MHGRQEMLSGARGGQTIILCQDQARANQRSELWNRAAAGETRRKEWTEDTQWKEKWQI